MPGGDNLGQIDDIVYFQKRLYRSLNVPINRLEQEAQFSLGRSTEISRDELKFQKFIDRLRKRFTKLFSELLRKQLILKGIITQDDWDMWANEIRYDFVRDNNFVELKEAELIRERMSTMDLVQQYIGEYLSKGWVAKNVLQLSEEEWKDMKDEIEQEKKEGATETSRRKPRKKREERKEEKV